VVLLGRALCIRQLVNLRVEKLLQLGELDFHLVHFLLLLDELLLVFRLQLLNCGLYFEVSVEQVAVLLLHLLGLFLLLLDGLLHEFHLLLEATRELVVFVSLI
jgi:hypothetical protein